MLTAEDFVYAWRRILNPETAAAYASILYVFKNAEMINSGQMPPEALGAIAIDERTLELQLENPAPYLTELLTHLRVTHFLGRLLRCMETLGLGLKITLVTVHIL